MYSKCLWFVLTLGAVASTPVDLEARSKLRTDLFERTKEAAQIQVDLHATQVALSIVESFFRNFKLRPSGGQFKNLEEDEQVEIAEIALHALTHSDEPEKSFRQYMELAQEMFGSRNVELILGHVLQIAHTRIDHHRMGYDKKLESVNATKATLVTLDHQIERDRRAFRKQLRSDITELLKEHSRLTAEYERIKLRARMIEAAVIECCNRFGCENIFGTPLHAPPNIFRKSMYSLFKLEGIEGQALLLAQIDSRLRADVHHMLHVNMVDLVTLPASLLSGLWQVHAHISESLNSSLFAVKQRIAELEKKYNEVVVMS